MSRGHREHATSWQYLADLDDTRRLVDELQAIGWPLPRIVWRARTLYRAAWKRELVRYRNAVTD